MSSPVEGDSKEQKGAHHWLQRRSTDDQAGEKEACCKAILVRVVASIASRTVNGEQEVPGNSGIRN